MCTRKSRLLISASALLLAAGASAAEFEFSLQVDEATAAEAKMLELYMNEAAAGEKLPRSIRAIVMQLIGETEAGAASQKRLDEHGMVLLDNGAAVVPGDDDAVTALLHDPAGNRARPSVNFALFVTPSGNLQRRACAVTVCTPTGDVIAILIPPVDVERGPHTTGKKTKCAFAKCPIPPK